MVAKTVNIYVVKMEVPDDPVSITCPQCTNTWVSLKDMYLMFDDNRILERGGKLIDKHINYSQRMLKSMFSAINGLCLTLLQDKPYKQSTSDSIQILHINGDHWVCATTVGTKKQVLVYDSWYTKCDEPSLSILQKQLHCSSSNVHILKNVQKQQGAKECGLHAIANATSIALSKDPLKIVYNEAQMCHHLVKCFRKETFSLANSLHYSIITSQW